MDRLRIQKELDRSHDHARRVHQETERRFPHVAERMRSFLASIDWGLVNETTRLDQRRSGVSPRFHFDPSRVHFSHNPQHPGALTYNYETGVVTINLGSSLVRAVVDRVDGSQPTQQDILMLFHGILHELSHAQAFGSVQYSDPHLEQHLPDTVSSSIAKKFRFSFGGQDVLEVDMKSGERAAMVKDFGLFWFEGMTELVAVHSMDAYMKQRSLVYGKTKAVHEDFQSFNKTYMLTEGGAGYSGPLRVLGIIINTIAKETGVSKDVVVDGFIRAYARSEGMQELLAVLDAFKVPQQLVQQTIHVGVKNQNSRNVEHQLIAHIAQVLRGQPEVGYRITYTLGVSQIGPYTVVPPKSNGSNTT